MSAVFPIDAPEHDDEYYLLDEFARSPEAAGPPEPRRRVSFQDLKR
ncbi:hypothetical protein [Jiangella gansuensis]|nr:hypothetical protein [Jiangella gansuensis]